ncbi:hypothetical protein ATANTOWER_020181 [Ataeniobius toweri]|uniref:Uncharacterized protein n=1 Tax=Ataeniobius toweri TaxID=208326 RepID=A0ABU7AQQ9_9TELE|nr:hypothetical protein [Ataeniobius toweri]
MEKQLHLNLLASRPPMAGGFQSGGSKMKMGPGRKRDFTPLLWSQYFETIEDVEVENENGKDISLRKPRFIHQIAKPRNMICLYGSRVQCWWHLLHVPLCIALCVCKSSKKKKKGEEARTRRQLWKC